MLWVTNNTHRLTLGTADWKRILVMGSGAEDNMEMITTNTSGRDCGQSCAKWNSTRKLRLSNTVTGNRRPGRSSKTEREKKNVSLKKNDFVVTVHYPRCHKTDRWMNSLGFMDSRGTVTSARETALWESTGQGSAGLPRGSARRMELGLGVEVPALGTPLELPWDWVWRSRKVSLDWLWNLSLWKH